jgi:DNA polymerase-1
MNKAQIIKNYIKPLKDQGIDPKEIVVFSLDYDENNKINVTKAKEYLNTLKNALRALQVEYLYVADGNYFKPLTKAKKLDPHYGYLMDCVLPGFDNMKAVLGVSFTGLYHNPDSRKKLEYSLTTLADVINGNYTPPGQGIIHSAEYPEDLDRIEKILYSYINAKRLTLDVETTELSHAKSLIRTIAFSWDEHNGFCFDFHKKGVAFSNWTRKLKTILKGFFQRFKGELIFHNASFDLKHLIFHLYMDQINDYTGMLKGLNVLTKNIHCTKIIYYLCTNNCVDNKLSLKEIGHPFAGNYAKDVKDVDALELPELKEYNLVDCFTTFWVFNKYYPKLKQEGQLDLYEDFYREALRLITCIELTGMPMKYSAIQDASQNLHYTIDACLGYIEHHPLIVDFTKKLQAQAYLKKTLTLKKKTVKLEDFDHVRFNPNSTPQLQWLLYKEWDLPVLKTTDKGQPAVGAKQLEGLVEHIKQNIGPADGRITVLEKLIELNKAKKIQNTFIKAFHGARNIEGTSYLFGNFNLTGTKSGRLSSSEPNLQNIPATGTHYAKLVKQCFQAPKGWLIVGADFDSLEDRISALTTKDPNKLKVYTDGYDGHSLRAYSYFGDRMPDINPENVNSINSIGKKYPKERQDSKGPTFALTYGGTHHALVEQCGFTKDQALDIESKYHELYKVSDQWVEEKIKKASKTGYVEVAFGLKLRTPLLAKTDPNKTYTPYEAQKEARTAGNALGQSYCMLNTRAAMEFMRRVWASPYKHDIRMICLIHDAIYLMVRNNATVVKWVNDNLTDCMSWQGLPEIQHPQVKLSGAMDIFYPTWADTIGVPVGATKDEIKQICREAKHKHNAP